MLQYDLSPEELETLKTYKEIALLWNGKHPNMDFWRSEFEKFQRFLPKKKIIDIGCGSGRDATLFVSAGYEYTGIDLSDDMLTVAKELVPEATFLNMNMYSLNFPDRCFDGFWATASLLHIPKKNIGIVLREIKRVVSVGGVGFIAMKEGKGEGMVDRRFFALYTLEEFREVLEKENFTVVEQLRENRDYGSSRGGLVPMLLYFVKV